MSIRFYTGPVDSVQVPSIDTFKSANHVDLVALYNELKKQLPTNGTLISNAELNNGTPDQDVSGVSVYIGTGGDIEVTLSNMSDGDFIIFKNLPDAYLFPIQIKKIRAGSNTTARDIIVFTE